LQSFSAQGIDPIVTVNFTPAWAQKVPNSFCGPIREDKLQAYASFMKDAVAYYGAPPYNVKYWELGNEPDVDPKVVSSDSVFGCWGDPNDPYYGGEYYAEMLKVIYPAIKEADPQAKVLIGGLLLDCDPTNPPEDKDCLSSKFFEGILKAGGGNYFDMVSFHGYPQYVSDKRVDTDRDFPTWRARGGVVMGKVSFLREVMSEYQVDKPLLLSESSLLCSERNPADCNPPLPDFFEAQADYVVKVYLRNWANNLGTIWFIFNGPGWRYGSMLDENQNPRPAYQAYQFMLGELVGAEYNKNIDQYPGLTGYQFTRGDRLIWALWSESANQVSISLPGGTLRVLDKFGQPIAENQAQLQISSPIYVELKR
jgi:hypothetical protein